MERRFAARMQEALEDAVVDPRVFRDVQPRLEKFLEPFVACLREAEQQEHARSYVTGLLSDLKRKTVEAVAYLHDQDRLPLQKFIGCSPWDHQPLLGELAHQIGAELGEADGVIVFDPSAHPKKGNESVGVQRQWCGRLGKIENCQVGIYMGYVSRIEQALVDVRLYLPESWASDKKRRKKAGVPKEVRFQTRHELALAMLDENGPSLPHSWVSGDDEMGRSTHFRRELQGRNERYLLMVPSNTLVRDLEAAPPSYGGRGPRPQVPFVRVDRWAAAQPSSAWTTIEIRPGEKGPLIVEAMKRRVSAKTDRRRTGPEEVLVVFREAGRRYLQTRLCSLVREGGDAVGGVCPCLQCGASHRAMPAACQGRSRLVALPGSNVARLASSSDLVTHRHLVPDAGSQAGKKYGLPRSRCRSSAGVLRPSCTRRWVAPKRTTSAAPARAAWNASSKRASTPGRRNTTVCHRCGLGNGNEGNSRTTDY